MARKYSNTATDKTLSVSISAAATSITVSDATGLPATFPYTLVIDPSNSSMEVVNVTAAAGTVLTVTRGQDSTAAVSHDLGATVQHAHTARDFSEPQDHIDATAAHGATGAVVGTTNTQTLTNKTISADSNTLSGIAASSFVLSNGSGNIDGSAAQKAIPSGVVVGTTDTQTLTNKTLTSPDINTGDLATSKFGSSGTAINGLKFTNANYTFDASGNATVTHGLGTTPVAVFADQTASGLSGSTVHAVSYTSTEFTLTLRDTAGAAITGSRNISWIAIA